MVEQAISLIDEHVTTKEGSKGIVCGYEKLDGEVYLRVMLDNEEETVNVSLQDLLKV